MLRQSTETRRMPTWTRKAKRTRRIQSLLRQLFGWLRQLPVIGFNSGNYDINVIKRLFVANLLTPIEDEDESCFVIKRQNTFMCFSTNKLRFLGIINYFAPGFSYDKYLKAYGCTMQKGLVHNRDVVPFLEAIDKQFAFYRQQNIDMFKYGISVPGLTLLYLFNDLPANIFFTVFNLTIDDLHHIIKYNIVGGPAIIFRRYHEKNVTKIRNGELCKSIVGYDTNALYLWAMMQAMPCDWYTRRREEKQFHPQPAQPHLDPVAPFDINPTAGKSE